MGDFAILQDDTVVNVIVAEDETTAEAVTGLDVLLVVDGVPGLYWTLESDGWRPPAPFPSWVWNDTAWEAPVPMPESDDTGSYVWDEDAQDWAFMPPPEPEPHSATE